MFIFKLPNNEYSVALDNTYAKVIMYNIITKKKVLSVKTLVELLHHKYSHSTYPECYDIPESTWNIGGRRWCSLKFAIADTLGLTKKEMYKLYIP